MARVNLIERALAPANIIKATPITSMIYQTEECKKGVSVIYDKWIQYMNRIAERGVTSLVDAFWVADEHIFEGYFRERYNRGGKFHFIPLNKDAYPPTYSSSYSPAERYLLNETLSRDRDAKNNLSNPSDKEYASALFDAATNSILLVYFPDEIAAIMSNSNMNNDSNNIYSPYVHPSVDMNRSVIGTLDASAVGVTINQHHQLYPTHLDLRRAVLGTQRPLYNTIVDTRVWNEFNSTLYGHGASTLNISLILVHVMCHLKCDIETNNVCRREKRHHGYEFVERFVNLLPPALYGHPACPLLTIFDKKNEIKSSYSPNAGKI